MFVEFNGAVVAKVWFVPVFVIVVVAAVTRVEFVDWSVSATVDVAWVVMVLFVVEEKSRSLLVVLVVSFATLLEGVVIRLLVVLNTVSLVVAFSTLLIV